MTWRSEGPRWRDSLRTRTLTSLVRAHQHLSPQEIQWEGLSLNVPVGVLSPSPFMGVSFARFLWDFAEIEAGQEVLDLGCGSGALGILAAGRGAHVVSTDLEPEAVRCALINAKRAGRVVDVREGDLFDAVPGMRFHRILFNAPFHLGEGRDSLDRAFYGGKRGEVLTRFLAGLSLHLHPQGDARLLVGRRDTESLLPFHLARNKLEVISSRTRWIPLVGEISVLRIRPVEGIEPPMRSSL